MPTKEKTWTQLEDEIEETFRKWQITAPTLTASIAKRSAAKRWQSVEERAVEIAFSFRGHPVRLKMAREERAIENLAKIAQAVEHVRMAESRTIDKLVRLLEKQMYPEPQQQAPPPRQEVPRSSGPYATLHVANDAPLAVCEAAYRALAKEAHPDQGGDTRVMQRLNAAIETIRKEKAKG